MKRRTLSVTLPPTRIEPSMRKLIKNAASKEGLPESQIVRRALRHYFDQPAKETA